MEGPFNVTKSHSGKIIPGSFWLNQRKLLLALVDEHFPDTGESPYNTEQVSGLQSLQATVVSLDFNYAILFLSFIFVKFRVKQLTQVL